MDIRNVNSGSNLPADRLQSEPKDNVNQVEESSSTKNDTDDTSTPTPQDRVEISDAGQMASADLSPEVMKLHMARRALENASPLSPERVAEIQERVQTGYYSEAGQIRDAARNIVHELLGMPPEGPGVE